jgi:hypothetical protein
MVPAAAAASTLTLAPAAASRVKRRSSDWRWQHQFDAARAMHSDDKHAIAGKDLDRFGRGHGSALLEQSQAWIEAEGLGEKRAKPNAAASLIQRYFEGRR